MNFNHKQQYKLRIFYSKLKAIPFGMAFPLHF